MANPHELLQALRSRLSRFLTRPARGRKPLQQFLRDLAADGGRAVLFGGLLRDLMTCRDIVHPRDVDVVVDGVTLADLEARYDRFLQRKTRFGGLVLNIRGWRVDIWPLEETWAFRKGLVGPPSFHALPETTFLNVEAIAVGIGVEKGRARNVFAEGFFEALLSGKIEINLKENPYPDLAIARALLTAAKLGFTVGPSLVEYVMQHGDRVAVEDLLKAQQKHYGVARRKMRHLRVWMDRLRSHAEHYPDQPFKLPRMDGKQLHLWDTVDLDAVNDR